MDLVEFEEEAHWVLELEFSEGKKYTTQLLMVFNEIDFFLGL